MVGVTRLLLSPSPPWTTSARSVPDCAFQALANGDTCEPSAVSGHRRRWTTKKVILIQCFRDFCNAFREKNIEVTDNITRVLITSQRNF